MQDEGGAGDAGEKGRLTAEASAAALDCASLGRTRLRAMAYAHVVIGRLAWPVTPGGLAAPHPGYIRSIAAHYTRLSFAVARCHPLQVQWLPGSKVAVAQWPSCMSKGPPSTSIVRYILARCCY